MSKAPTPLYRPRGLKCARVRLPDWFTLFGAASVGIPFYVHRDEIPNSAIRNMAFRLGQKLGAKYNVYLRPQNCYIEFKRVE